MITKKVFIHPIFLNKQQLIDYFKNQTIFDYDVDEKRKTIQYYKECVWKLENEYI
jgi:hypothetical protein